MKNENSKNDMEAQKTKRRPKPAISGRPNGVFGLAPRQQGEDIKVSLKWVLK